MGIGSVSRRYRDGPTAGLPSLRVKFRLFCHGRLQCVRNRPFSSPKTRHNQTEPLPKRRVSLIDHRFDDLVGAAGSFGYLSVTLPPALEFWPWPLERRRGLFPLVQTQCPLPEILTNASGGLCQFQRGGIPAICQFPGVTTISRFGLGDSSNLRPCDFIDSQVIFPRQAAARVGGGLSIPTSTDYVFSLRPVPLEGQARGI
jgi:hypothetical protein